MQRESFSEASSVSSADEGIAEPHNEGKVSPNPYSSMGSPDDRINTIIAVDDDEDEDVQIPNSFQPAATQIHPQHIELQPADPRLQGAQKFFRITLFFTKNSHQKREKKYIRWI